MPPIAAASSRQALEIRHGKPAYPGREETYWERHRRKIASGVVRRAHFEDPCGPAITRAWRTAAGEAFANASKPLRLLGDTLTVRCEGSGVCRALAAAVNEDFLARLHAELGESHPPVRFVRFLNF